MPNSVANSCHLCHIHDHSHGSTLLRTAPLRNSSSRTQHSHNHHSHHHEDFAHHHNHSSHEPYHRTSDISKIPSALAKLSERSHSLPGSRRNSVSRHEPVSVLPNGSAEEYVRGLRSSRHDLRGSHHSLNHNIPVHNLVDTRPLGITRGPTPIQREPDLLMETLNRKHPDSRHSTLSRVPSHLSMSRDPSHDYYLHVQQNRYKEEARKQRFNLQTVMLIGCYTLLFVVAVIVGVVVCHQNGWLGFGSAEADKSGAIKTQSNHESGNELGTNMNNELERRKCKNCNDKQRNRNNQNPDIRNPNHIANETPNNPQLIPVNNLVPISSQGNNVQSGNSDADIFISSIDGNNFNQGRKNSFPKQSAGNKDQSLNRPKNLLPGSTVNLQGSIEDGRTRNQQIPSIQNNNDFNNFGTNDHRSITGNIPVSDSNQLNFDTGVNRPRVNLGIGEHVQPHLNTGNNGPNQPGINSGIGVSLQPHLNTGKNGPNQPRLNSGVGEHVQPRLNAGNNGPNQPRLNSAIGVSLQPHLNLGVNNPNQPSINRGIGNSNSQRSNDNQPIINSHVNILNQPDESHPNANINSHSNVGINRQNPSANMHIPSNLNGPLTSFTHHDQLSRGSQLNKQTPTNIDANKDMTNRDIFMKNLMEFLPLPIHNDSNPITNQNTHSNNFQMSQNNFNGREVQTPGSNPDIVPIPNFTASNSDSTRGQVIFRAKEVSSPDSTPATILIPQSNRRFPMSNNPQSESQTNESEFDYIRAIIDAVGREKEKFRNKTKVAIEININGKSFQQRSGKALDDQNHEIEDTLPEEADLSKGLPTETSPTSVLSSEIPGTMNTLKVVRGEVVSIKTLTGSDNTGIPEELLPKKNVVVHLTSPNKAINNTNQQPKFEFNLKHDGQAKLIPFRINSDQISRRPKPKSMLDKMFKQSESAPKPEVVRTWMRRDRSGILSQGQINKDGSFSFLNCRPIEACSRLNR